MDEGIVCANWLRSDRTTVTTESIHQAFEYDFLKGVYAWQRALEFCLPSSTALQDLDISSRHLKETSVH